MNKEEYYYERIKDNKHPLVKMALQRCLMHNQNLMVAFVGGVGSGKSYASLRFAEEIDPDFNINNVCFSPQEFLECVKNTDKSASVIMFDEAGVGYSARDWYGAVNKILGYVLQTVRFKNHIILFTLPDFSFLDSQARKLFHCLFISQRIERNKNIAWFSSKQIKVIRETGDQYLPYVRVRDENSKIHKINEMGFSKPSDSLVDSYEAKRKEWSDELYNDATTNVKGKKDEKSLKNLTDSELAVWTYKCAGLEAKDISSIMKISTNNVLGFIKSITNKGFEFELSKHIVKKAGRKPKATLPVETP